MSGLPFGGMASFLSKKMEPVVHPDHPSIRHKGENLKAVLRVVGPRRTLMGLVSCYIPRRAFRRVEETGTTRAVVGGTAGFYPQHYPASSRLPSLLDLPTVAPNISCSHVTGSFLYTKFPVLCFMPLLCFVLTSSMDFHFSLYFACKKSEDRGRLATCQPATTTAEPATR